MWYNQLSKADAAKTPDSICCVKSVVCLKNYSDMTGVDFLVISSAILKMTEFYNGNMHDINHFLKVWAFAKTIGEQEKLDSDTQQTLELAAVVHDIACPLCREKYGNTVGKNQENESPPLIYEFFAQMPVGKEKVERILWLVSHHHTYTAVDSIDYQILLEADFLVNADESRYSKNAIKNAEQRIFHTDTGIRLLNSIYLSN